MQTSIATGAAHRLQRWRPGHLIAAAFAMVTLAGTAASSPTTPPATTYRIVPLAPSGHDVDINAKGQVSFTTDTGPGMARAWFYDGAVVRELGTFGGPSSVANALNDHGQVVGGASTSDGSFHAFRWSQRTGLVDLNPPGVSGSRANGINNKGEVVGSAGFPGTGAAFRWSPHTGMVSLGSLGPTSTSVALAINEAGTAVGWSEDTSEATRFTVATVWPRSGGTIPLSNFPSDFSTAWDINNAGQIVGAAAFDASRTDRAFIWTRQGGLQDLGAPPAELSIAERINEKGLAIGSVFAAPGFRRGFIWSRENGLLLVGSPEDESAANDVNNRGQVVGSLNGRAFIWTRAGGVVDLNSLVPGAPPEFVLTWADAISDNGTIVARGPGFELVLLVPNSAYHQPPVAGPVKLTGTARVNALLSFSASFTDVDVRDTHKAVWSWGDGSKTVGTVSERHGTGSVSGQHVYRAAGIYTVRLTIIDNSGKSSSVERKVIVCATHSAISGDGAFVAPAAAGTGALRASVGSFAFLSEGGAARKAVVQVNVAGMALRSSQVETVALDGARVQYSGQGTVNGRGNYRFTLTATSGAASGGKDRIHVRIAHTEPGSKVETVDYDNGAGTGAQAKAAGAGGSVVLDGGINFGGQ